MTGRPVWVRVLRPAPLSRHQHAAAAVADQELGQVQARRYDMSDSERVAAGAVAGELLVRFRLRANFVTDQIVTGDLLQEGVAGRRWDVRGKVALPGAGLGYDVTAAARSDV